MKYGKEVVGVLRLVSTKYVTETKYKFIWFKYHKTATLIKIYRLMGDSSPSSTFNLCMFFLSLEIHFLGIYWCFHLIQVIFRIFLSTPFPSWRYSLDFRPLVALETLNALSKFLVNSGYDCWVKKKVFSTNIEKWRVAGFKSERAVGLENLKKNNF